MPSRDPRHPNILFILTDDQGPWAMGCAGNAEIRTPNLDRLADTGTRFTDFFCTSPVCSPARASILTGRIPSQHGVHDWLREGNSSTDYEKGIKPVEYLEGQTGYTDLLAQDGYSCSLSGKWHLGDADHAQKGYTSWDVHARGGGPYYHAPMIRDGKPYEAEGYVTDVISDNALGFLSAGLQDSAPFYLGVHYTAPHSPWSRDNHPEELFDDYYNNCPFDSVPRDLSPAAWVRAMPNPVTDEETRRIFLSGYFAAVTAMDANVGRLLDWLEENGLRENTLVCFTSDNGMNMGHHGVYGKGNATFPQNMYEESVKVPCIVSQPGRVPAGAIRPEMASHYDWMPTILEYIGIDNPGAGRLPGHSFAPLLTGGTCEGNDFVVIYEEYGPVRMIRTRDWKYIHRYPYGPHELFHLAEDPGETRNLQEDQEHQARLWELRAALESWFRKYVDPELDGAHQGVTGRGQLCRLGSATAGRTAFYPEIWEYKL